MEDIQPFLNYTYKDYVEYLKIKYGEVKGSYFLDEACSKQNLNIKRTSDGLFCHHIDEYYYTQLSTSACALKAPRSCQEASHLVYCNIIEHLLLHLKICIETNGKMSPKGAETILLDAVALVSIPKEKRHDIGKNAWRNNCAELVIGDVKNLGEVIWLGYIRGIYTDLSAVCKYMYGKRYYKNDSLYRYLSMRRAKSNLKDQKDIKKDKTLLDYKIKVSRSFRKRKHKR